MSQLVIADGIFQGCGNMRLPNNSLKGLWPVLSGRYNEFVHNAESKNNQQAALRSCTSFLQ
jgi:hypothetical protein